jgi:general secretion pathway protein M
MESALPDGLRGRLLATALTAVLAATLWLACVAPLIGWYSDRAEYLAQRRAMLARMEALADMWGDLQRQAAGEQPLPGALLNGSSDALAAASLQETVQAMVTNARAQLASTETLPAEARGAYRRIALRISLVAPWPVLVDLLRNVATGQPTMMIDDLQVRGASGRDRGADVLASADMTIVAFRAPAEQHR